jgi:hypothetical protein
MAENVVGAMMEWVNMEHGVVSAELSRINNGIIELNGTIRDILVFSKDNQDNRLNRVAGLTENS